MTGNANWVLRVALATVVVGGTLLLDDTMVVRSGLHLSDAQARIGRPLTPMSYAGVARRTTRRAVGVGVVGVGVGRAYGRPGCYQAVDAYGRIYWRC
jgi:hypothetical protein